MKRILVLLTALVSLSMVGAVAAQADGSGSGGAGGTQVVVAGTIVSTDASAGTFVANAYVIAPQGGESSDVSSNVSGSGTTPTTTQVTISTDSNTKIEVNGADAAVSDLAAGQSFYAVFQGSPADSLSTITANPAEAVYAHMQQAYVAGTILSTDPSSNSFTADAFVLQGGDGQGQASGSGPSSASGTGSSSGDARRANDTAPTMTQVTITVGSNTKITVDGQSATINDLKQGQRFLAGFAGSPSDSLSTLTANPALSVSARTPESESSNNALYAFVGTVTATDTSSTPETVTVTVTNSLPSGFASGSQTFTVDPNTLVFGGSSNALLGSLGNVSVGDVVAGGVLAPAGQTLAQVEATPLKVLVDFPATTASSTPTTTSSTPTTTTTTTSTPSQAQLEKRALERALTLLGHTSSSATKAGRSTSHHHKHARKHGKHGKHGKRGKRAKRAKRG